MDEHMDERMGSCEGEQVGSGEEEVLTAREAARLLKVSEDLVYEAASRGEVPHRRLGRRMLFSRVALVGWLRAEAGRAVAERPRRRRAAG